MPVLNGGKLAALSPDVDRRGDPLSTAPQRGDDARSSTLGATEDAPRLEGSPLARTQLRKLFDLDGDAPVEALRATPLRDRAGIGPHVRGAITRSASVSRTAPARSPAPTAPSRRSTGSARARARSARRPLRRRRDPRRRRVGRSRQHERRSGEGALDDGRMRRTASPIEATPFALPGRRPRRNNAMLAAARCCRSAGGRRFARLDGRSTSSDHHVRAITFAADGSTSGAPITISAAGENAGQPAIALEERDDGKGVVAYLPAKR